MKIISVVGARPQFVKLAPIVRAVANYSDRITHKVIHTGQHYDVNMSEIFFKELEIAQPDYNLGVGSGTHAEQTGKSVEGIEKILLDEKPDHVIIYGDTNATLAGALAAVKLNIPISHIEAGLRSYNTLMPEEINRVIADRLANYLFCPDDISVQNLALEGITSGVFKVGDVMVDQLYYIEKNKIAHNAESPFIFMTLHRQETSNNFSDVVPILEELNKLSSKMEIFFPVHPRLAHLIKQVDIQFTKNFRLIDPLGYIETIAHIKKAHCVVTDSGGIQKEAYIMKTPCITIRSETEWLNTLEHGWNTIAGFDLTVFKAAYNNTLEFNRNLPHPDFYGDGKAANYIIQKIINL